MELKAVKYHNALQCLSLYTEIHTLHSSGKNEETTPHVQCLLFYFYIYMFE